MAYDPSTSFLTSDGQFLVKGREVIIRGSGGHLEFDDPRGKAARQERDLEVIHMTHPGAEPTSPNCR